MARSRKTYPALFGFNGSPLLVACTLMSMATSAVYGSEPAASDIFSTPDTEKTPGFMGRKMPDESADPLFGPGGDPPGRDAIRAIPSMSGKQLSTVDQLIFSNRDSITPLQEQVNGIRKILDDRKKQRMPLAVAVAGPPPAPNVLSRAGGDSMMMDAPDQSEASGTLAYADEPDEALKARIDSLNQQITEIKNRLWPSIRAVLTPEQLNQLQEMKYGRLMIISRANTDLPPPVPPALRQPVGAPHKPPSQNRPFGAPNLAPHSLVSPVMYTTKQLLNRALLGF